MTPAREPAPRWEEPVATEGGFAAWLRSPAPTELAAGAGALFVHGAVTHDAGEIAGLELTAGGVAVEPMAWRMPSPGLGAERPGLRGGDRAIFWGIVAIPAFTGSVELGLRARGPGGETAALTLATIAAAPAPAPASAPAAGPETVAICMATYEPSAELLERQLDSLRAQTHGDWICLISDDGSSPEAFAALERHAGADPRFHLSRAPARLGAYGNFARALGLAPPAAGYVALADQDDRWHPEKLATLLGALGEAELAFSDMRLTRPDGTVLSDTYWTSRQPNHGNFASLLLGNSVSGAASLFRRRLLERALPLPPRIGNLYHDHWLALVAAAHGPIAYVDRPLYDYVQHPRAVIGHAGANRPPEGGPLRRLAALRGRERGRLRGEWRRIYFAEYCRMALTAVALRERFGPALDRRRRRALNLALALDRSPTALAWLTGRQLRRLRRDDSGGAEAGMLRGLLWRRAIERRHTGDPLDDADLPAAVVGIDPTFPD